MSEAVEIIKFGNRTSITNWKEVRMFFLRRRRVFIGECDGQAVYYDQQTREALAAPKSFLLNTEGARKTNAYIPELVILLMAGGPAVFGFFSALSIGVYNWTSLTYILLFWLAEFLLMVAILERGLYKNVRKAQPTTEKVFYYAASHNLMVGDENFDPAKSSSTIYRIARYIIIAAVIYLVCVFYGYTQKFGQPIETNYDFWIAGFMFYIPFLFYNQNNPVRFVKIMKLYSQGKILFKKEPESETCN
ncbi:hypothetical protein HMPREF9378_0975 [Streptococcus sanguinis SK1 = NCTC 7863]|uniref:Uncharacterized protein n=3 Tax=Streptococcus sanguinis TaxID=1305 RepID=F2C7C7_STRSA|nr:hypothetical protein HMPREF9392_0923 [Streptococcus sanguinis SK678]EGF07874.1 hypothetical protein HMPREF9378_0975 [Streptococcus sanguinis SK1 = NCTC 7863]EGF14358.1 hypothetical protein HMPREF9386_1012 [Streptococcus sanguinis SK330]EGF18686.1 hypothetical protein HMPREF9391_1075 [Streptococcus sanguinis SK408]EGF21190.1 hypothetical protein HMPREF9395_1563 [Streptococcus sanguinis SK1058]